MSLITILLGGEVQATPNLKNQIQNSYIIAADSGIGHAASLGVKPDLWIGDFDSCAANDLDLYKDIERVAYDTDKNKTDGELALDVALDKGAKQILLCGAFGGKRFDHSLAHIAMALNLAAKNIEVRLSSGKDEAIALIEKKILRPSWPVGTCFSIIAFSELVGLTIAGARWTLAGDQPIEFGSTHAVSNIVTDQLQIELSSGRAMVVAKI